VTEVCPDCDGELQKVGEIGVVEAARCAECGTVHELPSYEVTQADD